LTVLTAWTRPTKVPAGAITHADARNPELLTKLDTVAGRVLRRG